MAWSPFSRGYNTLLSPDEVELPLLLVVRGNVHAAVVQNDRTENTSQAFCSRIEGLRHILLLARSSKANKSE